MTMRYHRDPWYSDKEWADIMQREAEDQAQRAAKMQAELAKLRSDLKVMTQQRNQFGSIAVAVARAGFADTSSVRHTTPGVYWY